MTVSQSKFRFADLFAGIGGFHAALKNLGGECAFACEIDKAARQTYLANHDLPEEKFSRDITTVTSGDIPDHDILCAGFPCQPFSQAGFKKGFEDIRGTLFFDIVRIIDTKRPAAVLLENVQHLLKHNEGSTFSKINNVITSDLGYSFYHKILRAADFGLPQNRPRLFMVAFKDDEAKNFQFPESVPLNKTMSDIFDGDCNKKIGYTLRVGGKGSGINDRRNWDTYMVDGKIKRLSINEALKMQGFTKDFKMPVSQTQAMKQLGNSVAIPVVQAVAQQILNYMKSDDQSK